MQDQEPIRELGDFVDPDELAEGKVPGEVVADEVNAELFGHEAGADTAGTTGLPSQKPVHVASQSRTRTPPSS